VTVGEVAQLAEAALVAMLGRASGRHLHALAHNRDGNVAGTRIQPFLVMGIPRYRWIECA
jgi:hypothetical protein